MITPKDLLALQDTKVTLASGVVEPGTYDFLMINLDEAQSYLVMTESDDQVHGMTARSGTSTRASDLPFDCRAHQLKLASHF